MSLIDYTLTIGLSGLARSGKDTFGNILAEFCKTHGINCNKISFAKKLKDSLDTLVQTELGFSAFTEIPSEKELIRPLLVSFGTEVMRKQNLNHWINKLTPHIKNNSINIITDLRFPNELKWIKDDLSGYSIHISRANTMPPNLDEETNDPILKDKSDLQFYWGNLSDENIASYKKQIFDIISNFIDEKYSPI